MYFVSRGGWLVKCCFKIVCVCVLCVCVFFVFFQAEDGIRDLVRSRGLGDVYKRQVSMDALTSMSFGPVSWP